MKTIENELLVHQEEILTAIENAFAKVGFAEITVPLTFVRDVVIWEIKASEELSQKDFYEIFDWVCAKLNQNFLA